MTVCKRVESELRMSRERAAGAEAELYITWKRAVVTKAHSIKMGMRREAVERAIAGAFIDGYEELDNIFCN